jgi:DNA-binding transcriptional LysR family regulator
MHRVSSDWNDYRYFLAVARAGSLSGAARQLRVDQSTVGRRIAALEARVGARVFDHTPEGYALTAAGDQVRADVERLEGGFVAVERRLAGADARIEGVVRVAMTDVLANTFIVEHLAKLRRSHPGLAIDLVTGYAPVDLARREADLAVRLGKPPRQPNLVVRPLGTAGFALYASQDYLERYGQPRMRGGLRGHQVVCYGGELAAVPLARFMSERAREAEVAFRANSVGSVHTAVAAGLGLGVLPCVLGDPGLLRIGRLLGTTPIWSVVHEDLVRNARVRTVLRFLSDLLQRERHALGGQLK